MACGERQPREHSVITGICLSWFSAEHQPGSVRCRIQQHGISSLHLSISMVQLFIDDWPSKTRQGKAKRTFRIGTQQRGSEGGRKKMRGCLHGRSKRARAVAQPSCNPKRFRTAALANTLRCRIDICMCVCVCLYVGMYIHTASVVDTGYVSHT
ncbi:hypothetical protein F4780DRAFT_726521 [Xylariomycetidae sp. FL0641]|nr:hypothetical protein F4780DRAFT_726521 [Xylariomycetidae sp. FL0641]